MSDPMTPDMHTAALQGLANNPIGQLYATAYQAGERAGAKTLGETTAVQAYGIGYQDGATLSMIVRDLMDAANYHYKSDRPLAEQARECGELINEHRQRSQELKDLLTMVSDRHEIEVQRLTDLVDELAAAHRAELLKRPDWHGAIYPGQCGICHKPFQPGTAITEYFDGPGWRAECCS